MPARDACTAPTHPAVKRPISPSPDSTDDSTLGSHLPCRSRGSRPPTGRDPTRWRRGGARISLSTAALAVLLLGRAVAAHAQDSTERSTGLPKKITWKFNFDAGAGAFGFANSLYTDVRPDPSGDLGDNWLESFIKPGLSATLASGRSQWYGAVSAVGERTFAAPPSIVGEDASSFHIEDAYLGWRSGTALGNSENVLDFSAGRSQYRIGQGFLLWDGGGEGGTRGGFWSNARKAWDFAGIARFQPRRNKLEFFYLDRDEVPERETGTKLWGANYELSMGENNTIGLSYMDFMTDSIPDRDGMAVFNVRAFLAPFKRLPGLSFAGEYANEDNGDLLTSNAWYAQGAYQLSRGWQPKLSYRYAFFEGDDPATAKNEGFDSLITGFYDWGTWWQGEIAGEYFLSNSNLISHQVRLHLTPNESLGAGLIGFAFQLDQPASFGPTVTSKDVATEIDAYADWKINGNFTMSFVAAYANPQEAATQAYNRTSNFTYGMIYLAYSY